MRSAGKRTLKADAGLLPNPQDQPQLSRWRIFFFSYKAPKQCKEQQECELCGF